VPPSSNRTTLGVVFLVLFLDLVGFSIVFPLFPAMLDHYAASGWLHHAMGWLEQTFPAMDHGQRAALFGGLLGAVYSGVQFIMAPWWGRLSDRIGRRPVLMFSIAGNLAAYALWVISNDFTLFLISRILAGVMTGNVAVASAAVADITSTENRSKGMAIVGMAFGLGFILGPALGGLGYHYLPRLEHIPVFAALGFHPFSMPALIAFTLGLVNLLWAWTKLQETLDPAHRSEPVIRPINPLLLFGRSHGVALGMVNLSTFLHTLFFSGLEATLVFLVAQHLGFSPVDNGFLFVYMGFEAALVQGMVFRRLAPRVGSRRLVLIGLAFLSPGFAAIALIDWWPHTWLLISAVTVLTVGTGLVFPGLTTMASLAAPAADQGWAMGGFRSANALGRALGPLLGAIVYFAVAPAGTYFVCAVGVFIPLILVARLRVGGPPPR
jgi:MFS family permease